MKITQHGAFKEYRPAADESVVLHNGRFIASRIDGKGSAAPGRNLQAICGKTADVDAEVARLGLSPRDSKALALARLPDERLAERKAKAEAALAVLVAEEAKRLTPKEIEK